VEKMDSMRNDQVDPDLETEILALPTLERVRLLHRLILSLEGKYDADAEALWFAEVARRAELALEDPDEPSPWADVKEILGLRMQRLRDGTPPEAGAQAAPKSPKSPS
jgi:putative addiction module component (TIGR02574 family)